MRVAEKITKQFLFSLTTSSLPWQPPPKGPTLKAYSSVNIHLVLTKLSMHILIIPLNKTMYPFFEFIFLKKDMGSERGSSRKRAKKPIFCRTFQPIKQKQRAISKKAIHCFVVPSFEYTLCNFGANRSVNKKGVGFCVPKKGDRGKTQKKV